MSNFGIYAALVLLFVLAGGGCGKTASNRPIDSPTETQPEASGGLANIHQQALIDRIRPQTEKFCADSHAMPRPSSSAREEWVAEVEQGYLLYETSGRTDLEPPDKADALTFFQAQAPETLEVSESILGYPESSLRWETAGINMPGPRPPGVTNVNWLVLDAGESPALVYCDIGTGMVKAYWPDHPQRPVQRLATLLQPVHVESCDLDADGRIDLVVADIGEFNANDSDLGRVVWLRRLESPGQYEARRRSKC